MAYNKTNWLDKLVQFPNRYKDQAGKVYDFERDEGVVTQTGTQVNASVMNNIENGIETIETELNTHINDNEPHPTAEVLNASIQIEVTSDAEATSVTSAPLKTGGGLAVGKNVHIGGPQVWVSGIPHAYRTATTASGGGIVNSTFGAVPVLADLYVIEQGTNKYLRAVVYKENSGTLPIVTVIASSGLGIGTMNNHGTINITGATNTANVKLTSIINGVGTQ